MRVENEGGDSSDSATRGGGFADAGEIALLPPPIYDIALQPRLTGGFQQWMATAAYPTVIQERATPQAPLYSRSPGTILDVSWERVGSRTAIRQWKQGLVGRSDWVPRAPSRKRNDRRVAILDNLFIRPESILHCQDYPSPTPHLTRARSCRPEHANLPWKRLSSPSTGPAARSY